MTEPEALFESVNSLHFKEIPIKFLLQIKYSQGKITFRVVYIAFGSEDFEEKKALFIELLKTLLFLFN